MKVIPPHRPQHPVSKPAKSRSENDLGVAPKGKPSGLFAIVRQNPRPSSSVHASGVALFVVEPCSQTSINVQALALSLIGVEDVLIDRLAFLLVQFWGIDPRKFIENSINGDAVGASQP
jgi:hypothetical protein